MEALLGGKLVLADIEALGEVLQDGDDTLLLFDVELVAAKMLVRSNARA